MLSCYEHCRDAPLDFETESSLDRLHASLYDLTTRTVREFDCSMARVPLTVCMSVPFRSRLTVFYQGKEYLLWKNTNARVAMCTILKSAILRVVLPPAPHGKISLRIGYARSVAWVKTHLLLRNNPKKTASALSFFMPVSWRYHSYPSDDGILPASDKGTRSQN